MKKSSTWKTVLICILIIIIILAIAAGGYFYYQHIQQQKVQRLNNYSTETQQNIKKLHQTDGKKFHDEISKKNKQLFFNPDTNYIYYNDDISQQINVIYVKNNDNKYVLINDKNMIVNNSFNYKLSIVSVTESAVTIAYRIALKNEPKKFSEQVLISTINFNISSSTENTNNTNNTPNDSENPLIDATNSGLKPVSRFNVTHWNIYNYGSDNLNSNSYKVYGIVRVLDHIKSSIIGLTEIGDTRNDQVSYIRDGLNALNPQSNYQIINQSDNDEINPEFPTSKESISILYDANLFRPVTFNNENIGASFKDKIVNIASLKPTTFPRFPFGVQFVYKSQISNSLQYITTFFAHFDSPGKKSPELSSPRDFNGIDIPSGQGANEVSEAFGLDNVFSFYKGLSNPQANILFGGDTNIRYYGTKIFNYIAQKQGLQSAYSIPSDDLKTSINRGLNYSQPYDRMLFYEKTLDFVTIDENPSSKALYRFDLLNIFTKYKDMVKEDFIQKYEQDYGTKKPANNKLIYRISDHTPVTIEAIVKK